MTATVGTHPSQQQRVLALDALRGLSILLMLFSSTIPFGVLPSWMYHAQEPPPTHVFNPNLPGITWVDLVFPFFLFTMGAAIPLALSRRLRSGATSFQAFLAVVGRGILLAGFAIYVMQIRPHVISNNPDWKIWLLALLGFAILFPVLAKLPENWSKTLRVLVRILGWGGAILFMALIRFPDGSGFSLYRSDIIILVLANVAVFGGLIWLISRDNWFLRLGIMGLLVAMRLSAGLPGWVQSIWYFSPFTWLYQFRFLQYLLITIPGTIIGDVILRQMNLTKNESNANRAWSGSRLIVISLLMVLTNVVVVSGLKARWVLATLIFAILLCLSGWALVRKSGSPTENLVRTIYKWGVYWLLLGLFLEPYEGGIKKDPATLSYYFVTGGLAIFILVALIIFVDIMNQRKVVQFLIDSGQNPMIAYAGINNLIPPILGLTRIDLLLQAITPTPWLGVLRGAFITYLVAVSTTIFTRKKIFLRT